MSGWRDHAACLGMDPDMFFPSPQDTEAVRQAERVCRGCPVRRRCAEWAAVHSRVGGYALQGVWGGRLRKGKVDL
ncbi:WhiB family transcriptional regulator [uncultured Bifidobacterium sp.]|uniref:WhiB family transcriptional regulator n=1 Tax=uncultured Bifidobacterium sp. TaxID=165187 RepID=UPI0026245CF5|nr:WhiB family transcriptional regulator [uncultured Bifidobacterium sp.]